MARAAELARLDAAYRAGLVRRQLGVTLAVSRLFGRLTINDIIGGTPSVDAWLDQSIAISMAVRTKVLEETATYLSDVREIAAPGGAPLRVIRPEPPTLEQIRTSLWVTGIVSARKRIGGADSVTGEAPSLLDQAFMRRATDPDTPVPASTRALEIIQQGRRAQLQQEIDLSGEMAGAAAARHVANASRDETIATVQADRRAIGWIRVTSGKPCFFCAALASRGPVYQDDSFDESDPRFEGPGQHKVHDHCSCSLRQVYSRSTEEWPALNQTLEDRWKTLSMETNTKYGRNPTLKDWRQQYTP